MFCGVNHVEQKQIDAELYYSQIIILVYATYRKRFVKRVYIKRYLEYVWMLHPN